MPSLLVKALGALVVVVALWNVKPLGEDVFKGKRVIVCGASTGIGEQLAYFYARSGAEVFIVARRAEVLEEVAEKARAEGGVGRVHTLAGDLSSRVFCKELIEKAAAEMGGIDVLVLNHVTAFWGFWGAQDTETMDAYLKNMFSINTFSYIYLATYALPHLEKTSGQISVVSSAAGKIGMPKVPPYSASKHALHGFFDSFRHELAYNSSSVSITLSVLGSIDTENNRKETNGDIDHIKRYPASEAAQSIAEATARKETEIYYPWAELRPLTYLNPFFPSSLSALTRMIVMGEPPKAQEGK